MNGLNSFKIIGLIVVIVSFLPSQEKVWLKLDQGDAVVLLPATVQWQPISGKTETPKRTFLLTKPGSSVKLYHATDVYLIPENCYVFVDDVITKNKNAVVAELTRIEAEQLPNSNGKKDSIRDPDVGLTYGKTQTVPSEEVSVPYRNERMNMVAAFLRMKREDGAVLTLKRMMTKYPALYLDHTLVEQLFTLYERQGLDGFLFDESTRLLSLYRNNDFSEKIIQWNKKAKQRLSE